MRMRKKKHGAERINACSDLLIEKTAFVDENYDKIWDSDTKEKLWLEIGCGKGAFVCGLAKKNPDKRIIALEKIADVCMLAMEKCKSEEITNVRFIIGDISKLWEIFGNHSIDRIYLNFSDPWPKKGHAKRRLTHKNFLDQYRRILKPDGAIFFKTDNIGLFEFSLEQFELCGYTLKNVTNDLHNSVFANENIMTEYEKNFSEKGFKINRAEAWCNSNEIIG